MRSAKCERTWIGILTARWPCSSLHLHLKTISLNSFHPFIWNTKVKEWHRVVSLSNSSKNDYSEENPEIKCPSLLKNKISIIHKLTALIDSLQVIQVDGIQILGFVSVPISVFLSVLSFISVSLPLSLSISARFVSVK